MPEIAIDKGAFPELKHSGGEPLYCVTIETTHDNGKSWSPPLFLYLKERYASGAPEIVGLRRET